MPQAGPSVKTQDRADLLALLAMVEAGTPTPLIDQAYPLTETPRAIEHVASGRTRGTVILSVPADGPATGATAAAVTAAPAAVAA